MIKDCGPEGVGLLSFPKPGISIALDIPIDDRTQALVDALNELVIAEGGRIYLAKDALTRAEHFAAMEPRLAEWTAHPPPLGPGGPDPQRAVGAHARGPAVKVALLGATRGMGRALARLMAERGDTVFLLGRDARGPGAQRARPRGAGRPRRHGGRLRVRPRAAGDLRARARRRRRALGGLDTVVVTAGLFATQDRLEADLELARRLLLVDFTNTVVFCEAARARLLARGGGTLCVFSSVAGERGRKPVVLYGAAKAGLSALPRGARPPLPGRRPAHRLREAGLRAHVDDRGAARAALRGRARGGGGRRPPRHRPRERRSSTCPRSGGW